MAQDPQADLKDEYPFAALPGRGDLGRIITQLVDNLWDTALPDQGSRGGPGA